MADYPPTLKGEVRSHGRSSCFNGISLTRPLCPFALAAPTLKEKALDMRTAIAIQNAGHLLPDKIIR